MLNQLDICIQAFVAVLLIAVVVLVVRLINASMGWDEDKKHDQERDR